VRGGTDELYQKYHDEEWGRLVTDDATMFEFLILEFSGRFKLDYDSEKEKHSEKHLMTSIIRKLRNTEKIKSKN
jgi:hypothetical protein